MITVSESRDLPAWLKRLYPFRHSTWASPDGGMNVVDTGSGVPVLLLHGNPTWSFFYRHLIQELAPDFRCIAPDHLGCGLSAKPQDESLYTLERHIERAEALVHALGLNAFHLVVHDWGGAIGMGLATRMPQRVQKIVLLNTGAFPSARIPGRIAACRIPLAGTLMVRGFNAFAGAATRMTTSQPMPADVRRAYVYPYNNWRNRIAVNRFVRDIPMDARHPSYGCLRQIAGRLDHLKAHEILICWGGRDWCFDDSFYNEWRRRFPDARTEYHASAGHYLMEDESAAIPGGIGRFLRSGETAGA